LLMARVRDRLEASLGRTMPMVTLFRYPTVRALAGHLDGDGAPAPGARRSSERAEMRRAARGRRRGAGPTDTDPIDTDGDLA
ncbi:MAG TPA: acyl carrier protein, partial [Longimicrobium sp.]|nr:acyl carrier protein [Longimicrobium sp.]